LTTGGFLSGVAALITAIVGALTFYFVYYVPSIDHSSSDGPINHSGLILPVMATIKGTDGRDTLIGTNKADNIQGLGKDDVIHGGAGNDIV
jgi:Ca2+-binding RTX toxin-like protein